MGGKISDIKIPIEQELKEFEQHFKKVMKSDVPLLDKVTYYIVQRKGKQVRPMFIFLTAKMCGTVNNATFVGASLVELLHTATLVHDDVVDDANKRRGFLSVNALWKNKIAVLVGDYLLAKGLLHSLDTENYNLLHILSNAIQQMSEGELLQMEKARKLDISEEIYYEIIRNKTASLIAAACEVGAASVSKDKETIKLMRKMGENIGMAFQIKDDLFDYGEKEIGKPRGIDIKERKMTLPLIYTINNASKKDKKWIKNIVKKHNNDKKKVNELISFVKASGGIQYSIKRMNFYKQEAYDILEGIPPSSSKSSLYNLVNFITERSY